jgi:hypothetical protein
LALLTVPAASDVVSFTDLTKVKQRLGYPTLTSDSPTRERFDFWKRARADGAMLTATRLYDASSVMSLDYGWTAEDVDWEIDYTGTEHGCVRSMICDPGHGFVLALRKDLDWRMVEESLADNGFTPVHSTFNLWSTDRSGQPFDQVLLIPELQAIASGNEIGLGRIADVVAGAPSLGAEVADEVSVLGPVESAYLDQTGCVTLGEALGPDATDDEVIDYFKANDPSGLATAEGYVVGISGVRTATAVVSLEDLAPADEASTRHAIVANWPGLQVGMPFAEIADARVRVDGSREVVSFAVHAMPTFVAMVLTHDAPWALCPSSPPA